MNNILITGDIHSNFESLNNLISKTQPDLIICVGDFGYWPRFSFFNISQIELQSAKKLLWCDGNHEDHWALKDRSTDELAPNIIYMPRGSTYILPDGRTIMFMGGAYSIDKNSRTIGYDWFPEETITQKDMMNLPDIKIDIFITHTCPIELVKELALYYPEKGREPSNYALSKL